MDLKYNIAIAAMDEFRTAGLRFTMQDVAARMHISKKTIYTVYPSKEDLMIEMLNIGFSEIHRKKQAILNSDLDLSEKLRRVITAMPDEYLSLDFRRLRGIEEQYPRTAAALKTALETNWEPTLTMLRDGIESGAIRGINIPVLRVMITASIETLLSTDLLESEDISWQQAMDNMMDILMNGLRSRGDEQ